MNNFSTFIAFVAGAAIGSAITWKIVKTKYEQIAQEEIDSVKEVLLENEKKSETKTDNSESDDHISSINEKPSLSEYREMLKNQGYSTEKKPVDYSDMNIKKGEDNPMNIKPYVISPDELYENDYETESLTYWDDGVLTDDMACIVENVDELVGLDSLNHFGEYENDSVFVRNDKLKIDFEILADSRKYSEVFASNDAE